MRRCVRLQASSSTLHLVPSGIVNVGVELFLDRQWSMSTSASAASVDLVYQQLNNATKVALSTLRPGVLHLRRSRGLYPTQPRNGNARGGASATAPREYALVQLFGYATRRMCTAMSEAGDAGPVLTGCASVPRSSLSAAACSHPLVSGKMTHWALILEGRDPSTCRSQSLTETTTTTPPPHSAAP